MENTIISPRALCNYTLAKWRMILVIALVLACIAGGYSVVQYLGSVSSGTDEATVVENPNYEEEYSVYTEAKSALESEIAVLQSAVDSTTEYVEDSMVMKVDYRSIHQTTVDMFIQPIEGSGSEETMGQIINEYNVNMLESDMYDTIKTELGYEFDVSYIREFVFQWNDRGTGQFTIVIKSTSLEENQIIADIVIEKFQTFYNEVNGLYSHELVVNQPNSSIIREDGYNTQQQTRLSQLEVEVEKLVAAELELEELEMPLTEIVSEPEEALTVIQLLIRTVIYMMIGGILGAGISLLGILLYPILTNKIQDGRYIQDEFNVTVYGSCPRFPKKNHWMDRWIFKKFTQTEHKGIEEFYSYIWTRIALSKTEKRRICLLGTVDETILQDICERLRGNVEEVFYCRNIGENEQDLKKVVNADSVILVEKAFVTKDADLAKEITILKELKKDIQGAIVL